MSDYDMLTTYRLENWLRSDILNLQTADAHNLIREVLRLRNRAPDCEKSCVIAVLRKMIDEGTK